MTEKDSTYRLSTADTIQIDLHKGVIPCLKCGHHIHSSLVHCPSCGSTQTKMKTKAEA